MIDLRFTSGACGLQDAPLRGGPVFLHTYDTLALSTRQSARELAFLGSPSGVLTSSGLRYAVPVVDPRSVERQPCFQVPPARSTRCS